MHRFEKMPGGTTCISRIEINDVIIFCNKTEDDREHFINPKRISVSGEHMVTGIDRDRCAGMSGECPNPSTLNGYCEVHNIAMDALDAINETLPVMAEGKVIEEIEITPEWSNVARWMAFAIAEHGFDNRSYQPVASLIEQVRYLCTADPEGLQKLIDDLNARGEKEVPIHSHGMRPELHVPVFYRKDAHNHYPEDDDIPRCTVCGHEIEVIDGRWELTAND
jgi:hypothetical protein